MVAVSRVLLIVAGLCLPLMDAHSADVVPCADVAGRQYAVIDVVDGETLKLDSGDDVRLTGIVAPRSPLGDESKPWPPHEAAMAFLKGLVVGRRIEVRPLARVRARDRYGRLVGHVVLGVGEGEPVWLEEALVRAGHARVFGIDDRAACQVALLRAEDEARRASRGLWASDVYRVRRAEDVGELAAVAGTFQIVDGMVQSVSVRGSRAYLNFGSDWARDFTVVAAQSVLKGQEEQRSAPREARAAARRAADAALTALQGQRVRVRGWVRYRNGPMIEILKLEDVERVEP